MISAAITSTTAFANTAWRGHERCGPARRVHSLRRQLPDFYRLLQAVDPFRRTDEESRHLRHGPTIRSVSAKTVRPTSRWNTWPGCAPSRTSSCFDPPMRLETAECWQIALENETGPSILSLSRQPLPTLRTEAHGRQPFSEGRICSRRSERRHARRPGRDRRRGRHRDGGPVISCRRKVSAPASFPCRVGNCSSPSPRAPRDEIIGEGVVRIGVEAGSSLGWGELLGRKSDFVGMATFGASAPDTALFEHFGFTAESVAQRAKALL